MPRGRKPTIKPLVKCGGCDSLVAVHARASFFRGQYWCSQECKKAVSNPVVSCPQCGKEHRRRIDASRKNGTFCSKHCWYEHKKRDGEQRDCMECGKPVWKPRGQLRRAKWFCSRECSFKSEHQRRFKNGEPTCVVCGKQHRRQGKNGGAYKATCSRECADVRVRENIALSYERGRLHFDAMTALYGEWWPTWRRLRGGRKHKPVSDWRRKWGNIISGHHNRSRDLARPRKIVHRRISKDWGECFKKIIAKVSCKIERVKRYAADPWARKFDTMSRNWRRKAALMEWERNGRNAASINARIPRQQMCFEWSNAES